MPLKELRQKQQNKQTEFLHLVLAVTSNFGTVEMGRARPLCKKRSDYLVLALLFTVFLSVYRNAAKDSTLLGQAMAFNVQRKEESDKKEKKSRGNERT